MIILSMHCSYLGSKQGVFFNHNNHWEKPKLCVSVMLQIDICEAHPSEKNMFEKVKITISDAIPMGPPHH